VDWAAVSGVATAAGSLVSAGALVVAALTLVNEGRRWRADRRSEEDDRHAAERGLASFVFAITEEHDDSTAVVVAANYGERPVFNVRVFSAGGAQLIDRSDDPALGDVIRRLNPHERVSFRFRTLPGEGDFSRPVIDFFDMDGRRWRRTGSGAPERRTGWWEDETEPR